MFYTNSLGFLTGDPASPLSLESSLFMPQVLFRPITVMVPDLVLICENMLMAEGFIQAKTLASKFHEFYLLLRELLSKQVRQSSCLVFQGGEVPFTLSCSRYMLVAMSHLSQYLTFVL